MNGCSFLAGHCIPKVLSPWAARWQASTTGTFTMNGSPWGLYQRYFSMNGSQAACFSGHYQRYFLYERLAVKRLLEVLSLWTAWGGGANSKVTLPIHGSLGGRYQWYFLHEPIAGSLLWGRCQSFFLQERLAGRPRPEVISLWTARFLCKWLAGGEFQRHFLYIWTACWRLANRQLPQVISSWTALSRFAGRRLRKVGLLSIRTAR